jgi:hypothetical protein
MLLHLGGVTLVGNNKYLIGGGDVQESLKRKAQQALAIAYDIEKLLRLFFPAGGPESGADTAGHDGYVSTFIHGSILQRNVVHRHG